jgi:hypothetical protein
MYNMIGSYGSVADLPTLSASDSYARERLGVQIFTVCAQLRNASAQLTIAEHKIRERLACFTSVGLSDAI